MVRKTTAAVTENRRERRLPPQQMDLFSQGVAAGAPNWLDLPKGAGICGLSRLSPRSLVATPTFMLAGFLTVYVIRHIVE